jgi:hypothetical protein
LLGFEREREREREEIERDSKKIGEQHSLLHIHNHFILVEEETQSMVFPC